MRSSFDQWALEDLLHNYAKPLKRPGASVTLEFEKENPIRFVGCGHPVSVLRGACGCLTETGGTGQKHCEADCGCTGCGCT